MTSQVQLLPPAPVPTEEVQTLFQPTGISCSSGGLKRTVLAHAAVPAVPGGLLSEARAQDAWLWLPDPRRDKAVKE